VEKTVKFCKWCKGGPFVWYKSKGGRWMLAAPKKDSLDPNPHRTHQCALEPTKQNKKGRKPSAWRLGKSPSSYG
jgi:hypothetical protein